MFQENQIKVSLLMMKHDALLHLRYVYDKMEHNKTANTFAITFQMYVSHYMMFNLGEDWGLRNTLDMFSHKVIASLHLLLEVE